MEIIHSKLKGSFLVEPDVFGDERGFFMETWNQERFAKEGINLTFVQDNVSKSEKGVLRGLHYQIPRTQGKFVYVLEGEVYDVIVDIRVGSPTYGEAEGYFLNDKNRNMLYVPEGFAHGFLVTSDTATFAYKCTDTYHPEFEKTLLWNDPALKIAWPLDGIDVNLSAKDKVGLKLSEISEKDKPVF